MRRELAIDERVGPIAKDSPILACDDFEAAVEKFRERLLDVKPKQTVEVAAKYLFPQPPLIVLMTQVDGMSVLHETVYEDRLGYVDALKAMGGEIELFDTCLGGPACRFHEATTSAGLDALGWYHEKQDETRNVGLGPEHDWASHGADAFGLMCVAYEAPTKRPTYAVPDNNWVV